MSCYQKTRKNNNSNINFTDFLLDGATIMVPILIIAFCVYFIQPKDGISARENIKQSTLDKVPYSACDCEEDYDIEGEEVMEAILSKR